ncbi:uncharacterized protein B0H18DRAFT_1123775 [Fomitopsis serialis]|uniref:uncharacterized protein n=1 Tax=Fomitopsis serialis TaxID=139415 RepID=UPI002007BB9C|nr:uncharacterized protein B0H18DRAFT_1123775 [Neoantrodia serialis]KAH9917180.1 hypothetical protein B0H18DRAFT_1123775 [Neoantrodia serialis]
MRIYFEEAITPLVQPHWQLSTVALPVLVSMDLTAVSGLSSQWIPSYFPSLRRLSLYRLSIDDTNLSLSQLTSLELNEIHFRARSLASLLDVLKTCTSLRHFVYGDTDDTPFKKSSVAAGYRVSLPRIRHFLIIATSANISSLLAHVLLAKQTRILLKPKDFHPRQDENDHLPVLNAILPRDAAYWPAMKDVTHIMVWWEEGDGITVYADGKNTEFWESHPWRSLDYENLSADGLSPAPALFIEHINIHSSSFPSSIMGPLLAIVEELGDLFPASAKTFVLRGYAEEISTETWAQTLARFPVIEHFELVAEVDAMCTFPLALRPTSSGIPCPRLRELVLRYEAGAERDNSSWRMLDDLRVVLQERVGGGSRLQSLILQLDPPPEVEVFELFRQSTLLTATGRWPPDFEDIQRELALLVGSLKISYRGPYDEWITVV